MPSSRILPVLALGVAGLLASPAWASNTCSAAAWATEQHREQWPGLRPSDRLADLFDLRVRDRSLLATLERPGGGRRALAREAVAAWLNARHPAVDYPLSPAEVRSLVAAADGNRRQVAAAVRTLAAANGGSCALDGLLVARLADLPATASGGDDDDDDNGDHPHDDDDDDDGGGHGGGSGSCPIPGLGGGSGHDDDDDDDDGRGDDDDDDDDGRGDDDDGRGDDDDDDDGRGDDDDDDTGGQEGGSGGGLCGLTGSGCTPAYWSTLDGIGYWPPGSDPQLLWDFTAFDNAFPGRSLFEVLTSSGLTALDRLGSATLAAFFSASRAELDYPVTQTQVVDLFNSTFPGTDAEYDAIAEGLLGLTVEACALPPAGGGIPF